MNTINITVASPHQSPNRLTIKRNCRKKYLYLASTVRNNKTSNQTLLFYFSRTLNLNMSCTYCTNIEIKARRIVENEYAYAFPTNIPIVPGHTLVCPKRCVAKFDELTIEELNAIRELTLQVTRALTKTFEAEGFNFAWNEGSTAGQNVPHFHLHILPRKKGDTGILEYEPRKFLYRTGSREPTPEKELQEVANIIKKSLKAK
jgi:histidine triad (HIT) family protein